MLSFFQRSGTASDPQGAWGEELLDQSLDSLWHRAEWTTILPDELVFLMPVLISERAPNGNERGPIPFLEQRFATLIHTTTLRLGTTAGSPHIDQLALERIRASGAIESYLARQTTAQPYRCIEPGDTFFFGRLQQRDLEAWVYDLCVLACVDRMLHDAVSAHLGPAPLLAEPDLCDALVASIHTRLNAGYVYPSYAYAHELLMTGAWLGVLLAGRSAYMPPAVANVLLDYLDKDYAITNSVEAKIASVLKFYSDLTCGCSALLNIARTVTASDAPLIVSARRSGQTMPVTTALWNKPLAECIVQRLLKLEVAGRRQRPS